MKITALYNTEGIILAAVEVNDDYDGPLPVATEEAEVGTFDVPARARELRLDDICLRHRIDRSSNTLVDEAD